MAKRGGTSRPIQQALARPKPRQSAPARVEQEIIEISSDEDDEPLPPPQQTSAPEPSETITIVSSGSGSNSPQPGLNTSPIRPKQPQSLGEPYRSAVSKAIASASRTSRPRPKPRVPVTRKLSLNAKLDKAELPHHASSNRNTPSPPQKKSPPANQNVYRTALPGISSDAESQSSSEMVETLLAGQPEQKSIVLGSNSSTSENADDEKEPVNKASPRKSAPIPSSPTSETEPEPEPLVESIANVSLYDELTGQDKEVAQAAEAVESVSLDVPETFDCSIGDCMASFSSAGQLHTHTSRDHGIRLHNKIGKKKRKASDAPENVPAKRRTTALPPSSSLPGTSRASPASGASTHSAQSQTSNRFIQRKNTVGFESFAQRVSSQEHSVRPFNVDQVLHESSSSPDSAPASRPMTPPQIPNMRAPQPNLRPPVPDEPSQNLSPSKQRAQIKDEVIIPGDELVTWRVDLVNSMPDSYRKSIGVRAVFEAYMDDAMRLTEPCASAIQVENMVDSEPCPPWEFVYYNTMLYGTNVPKPDLDALEGCDCLGPCDPENQDCSCVRRQERYYAEYGGDMDGTTGFGCAEDGTIKYQNGAVFGCNSKCSCDLECSNKVGILFLRNRVCVSGGVFAKENIPAGRFIGIYTGELLTEGMASKRAPVYDNFGRTYVLNIDFHHIAANKDAPTYAVDAFHAGNFTRFFNHSCEPNLKLTAYYCDDVDIQKPLIALFTCVDVKAGSELTFSYTGLDVYDEEYGKSRKKSGQGGKPRCLKGAFVVLRGALRSFSRGCRRTMRPPCSSSTGKCVWFCGVKLRSFIKGRLF
ncbi:SET domain-containing protein [Rhizoctonia solani AG-1 IA]|uniref:SET domain-containing protein n=1 Tax=Thanatephorus cucumeris (strain AG1-IA) TaxID=983506 RepID=L8WS31_THACA|nr:SET domain-containing protein [Rhizoctonia solani AG-1 IA]